MENNIIIFICSRGAHYVDCERFDGRSRAIKDKYKKKYKYTNRKKQPIKHPLFDWIGFKTIYF